MELEIIIILNAITVLTGTQLWYSTREIDKFSKYNNSKSEFISPSKWMKKLFSLRSQLIPKFVYYRCFSISFVLLGPIGTLIYVLSDGDKIIAKIFIFTQAIICLANLIAHFAYSIYYNKKRIRWEITGYKKDDI